MKINLQSPTNSSLSININETIPSSKEEAANIRVWNFVKPIFSESLYAIALNLVVIPFYATPISIPLLTISVITSLSISCLFAFRDSLQKLKEVSKQTENAMSATQILSRGAIVDNLGLSKPNILIHELGHYAAAGLCFKDPKAKIMINPYQGGGTSYTASNRLTPLGKLFGKSGSMLVNAAAGLVSSTVFICSELAIAHKIQKTHPNASQYMNLHAISHLFHEVIYGLSVFFASKQDLSHDLMRLWKVGGIHPALPIGLLIAIPLIQVIAMKWKEGIG